MEVPWYKHKLTWKILACSILIEALFVYGMYALSGNPLLEETQCTKTEAVATMRNEVNWACQDDCCDINHSESPDVYPRVYDVWAQWCTETSTPFVCTGESKQIYACNKSHAVTMTNTSDTRECFKRVGKRKVFLSRFVIKEDRHGFTVSKQRPMESEYPPILFPLSFSVAVLSIFCLLGGVEAYCDCKQCENERNKITPTTKENDKQNNDKQTNVV